MSATFKVIGLGKVSANLLALGNVLDAKTKKALTDEGNSVLKEAMEECPVETGTLRRSGTVEDPKVFIRNVSVEIGFNTDYAAAVHENLKAHHKKGKAKYLEDPVNRATPGFEARLAARLGRF